MGGRSSEAYATEVAVPSITENIRRGTRFDLPAFLIEHELIQLQANNLALPLLRVHSPLANVVLPRSAVSLTGFSFSLRH